MNPLQNTTLLSATRNSVVRIVQRDANLERVHERFFNNILMLTYIYPPTKRFNEIFKKDMFLKNNKAAFHQVVYYLLDVLNPELTKKRLTSWPPFDTKMENKFRSEVLTYINELKTIYCDIKLPTIMGSHLLSAGGIRFVEFMLKLSLLVLHETLKKDETISSLLTPISAHKNPAINKIVLNNLKLKTAHLELNTLKLIEDFDNETETVRNNAFEISKHTENLYLELQSTKKIYDVKLNSLNKPFPLILQNYNEKLVEIETKLHEIDSFANISTKCFNLTEYLLNNNSVLKFNADEVTIPNQIQHLVNIKENSIDLNKLINSVSVLLNNYNLELPNYIPSQLDSCCLLMQKINFKSLKLSKRLNDAKLEQINLINQFKPECILKKIVSKELY